MSRILCIIDGMTDPQFRASDFPQLAGMQLARYVDTCRGHAPESLGCILRLLGVAEVPEHLRGYAEALGEGVPVGQGDLILRGSWFAVERGICTRPVPGPESLATDGWRYCHLAQYKSLLVFPGGAEAIRDIVTFPPYVCAGKPVEELCPLGCAALAAAFRGQWRDDRCLRPWGQSVAAALPPFPERGAVVTGTSVVKGIAHLLELDLLDDPRMTGEVDTDLELKAETVLRAAEEYPFVVLHINGTDEAGHRKDAGEKRAFLHRVDGEVLGPLARSGHELYVVADHGTDPVSGCHMDFPQPGFTTKRA